MFLIEAIISLAVDVFFPFDSMKITLFIKIELNTLYGLDAESNLIFSPKINVI
jgi:hypothetical protein